MSLLDCPRELETLVDLPSWSHDLTGLDACAEAIMTLYAPHADSVDLVDLPAVASVAEDGSVTDRPLGRAIHARRRPSADRRILLVGHYDTVFPGDSGFSGVTRHGETWIGPGVVDAKGGIVVALEAIARAEAEGLTVGWDVVLVPDEEIGSPGSAPYLATSAGSAQLGLGYEPAMPDGRLAGARPGSANLVHVVRGRSAHAGRELHLGRNAVLAAAKLAMAIDDLNDHPDVLANPGVLTGGSGTNIVPDLAVLRSNIRPRTDEAAAWVDERLAETVATLAVDGISIEVHGGLTRPPKEMSDRYRALLDAVVSEASDLGIATGWTDTGGVCDGNNVAGAGLVNVDNLGPVGGDLHRHSEYLDVTTLDERAALSARLIRRFDAGEL